MLALEQQLQQAQTSLYGHTHRARGSGIKRNASQAQLDEQDSSAMQKLANEISAERLKKQRLEWYLSEILKEKEQLMRENSYVMQCFNGGPPCAPVLAPTSSEIVPLSTNSPTVLSTTADEASSPALTSPSVSLMASCEPGFSSPVSREDEWESALCASPSLPAELILLEATESVVTTTTGFEHSIADLPAELRELQGPSDAFAFGNGASPHPSEISSPNHDDKLRELEQCLNLGVDWLCTTSVDDQAVCSSLHEYLVR